MCRHEDPSPTLPPWTLPSQALDLPCVVNLVVLEDCQLHLLLFMLDFLWGGVVLLLPFLSASPQPQDQVEGRLLLDVVVRQSATILKLFAGKYEPLLVRRDS